MANLLQESLSCLEDHGKSPAEFHWVDAPDYRYFSWDEFAHVADAEYDGYGSQHIAKVSLLLVKTGG